MRYTTILSKEDMRMKHGIGELYDFCISKPFMKTEIREVMEKIEQCILAPVKL